MRARSATRVECEREARRERDESAIVGRAQRSRLNEAQRSALSSRFALAFNSRRASRSHSTSPLPPLCTPGTQANTICGRPNEHYYCFCLTPVTTEFVSGNTLKIGSFHKLQPDFPLWHNPLFSKMKKQFYSKEI